MSDKLEQALTRLAMDQPFFGTLLAMSGVSEEPGVTTMATDGERIFYNKAFLDKLTNEETAGVLMHELLHIAYLHCHPSRRAGREHFRWNAACDFAVNQELAAMDYKLPEGILLDKKFDGLAAEQIYDNLPPAVILKCLDEHLPLREQMSGEMIGRVLAAAAACSGRGRLPAGIARLVKGLRRSRVPWQRLLRRYLRESLGKEEQSYLPPNRRRVWQEQYLPGPAAGQKGRLVVAVDTSGSISKDMLETFAAELKAISAFCETLTVMTCDAKVHEAVRADGLADFLKKLKFKGGGGTDFQPVFDQVAKNRLRPDVLLYLTDGCGTFPKSAPKGYPVLWCLTSEADIPWGRQVELHKPSGGSYA